MMRFSLGPTGLRRQPHFSVISGKSPPQGDVLHCTIPAPGEVGSRHKARDVSAVLVFKTCFPAARRRSGSWMKMLSVE